jgi:hypothetical protein
MPLRRKQCRSHPGGIFSYQSQRGRQPVRCKPENPCDKAAEVMVQTVNENHPQLAQRASAAPKEGNPSLTLAKEAKSLLEAAGWVCKGRAWTENASEETYVAELTCSRGNETLNMQWVNNELREQQYAMEFLKPAYNGYPDSELRFNPDELTDSELVRMIKGMKVTWWNTIAGAKESAIVGGTVTVEHIFRDNGDEDNSKRIVKFLDHGGGGFRAFHVGALVKVGS